MMHSFERSDDLFFVIVGKKTLVKSTGHGPEVLTRHDLENEGFETDESYQIGVIGNRRCYCMEIEKIENLSQGLYLSGIWRMFNYLDPEMFKMLLRSFHLLRWIKDERYCSYCSSELKLSEDNYSKWCLSCGKTVYPRISPAVIVLIYRDREILLARSRMFKDELYSCVAGFVEPGETLEDTVRREIKEELGIEVEEIKYFGSQPWPFPDSLMIAFTARYKSGELCIDAKELVEARWFHKENLPKVPGKISIARSMIDSFFDQS